MGTKMSKMTAGILKLDEIPAHVLLMVNMAIAGFVGLAHGGALAATLIQEPENLGEILPLAGVSLPIATVILISSIVVLISKKWLMPVLSIHSIMLCCGSVAAFVWISGILLNGIPEGNFGWSPGMMTFICVYPFYLLRITLLRKYMTRSVAVRYLHVLVFVIALAMDLGVFFNFKSSIKSRRESFFDSNHLNSDSRGAGADR